MTYRIPPLTGKPCSCEECVIAGVSHLPVVRTPDGELHGRALARFHVERDKTIAALKGVFVKSMSKADVQTYPNGEPLS